MAKNFVLSILNAHPSTQGSGCNVLRLIPMTLIIVLIADTPSHPDLSATLAGYNKNRLKSLEQRTSSKHNI